MLTHSFPTRRSSDLGAGILHTCVMLAVGPLCGGYNLYNNGFAAGLVALILVSIIQDVFNRKPINE